VALLGAVDQAQGALGSEAAHGMAHRLLRNANAAGEPNNPETELAFTCKPLCRTRWA
jgi:hypothetical protein